MSNDFDWDRAFQETLDAIEIRVLDARHVKYTTGQLGLLEMVERMLVDPDSSGIAVVLDQQVVEGTENHVEGHRHFRLDPNVPFGQVYEFASMAQYEIWYERGCIPPV